MKTSRLVAKLAAACAIFGSTLVAMPAHAGGTTTVDPAVKLNCGPRSQEFMRARNLSRFSILGDPVAAIPGDTLEVMMCYDNSGSKAAQDVSVRINAPSNVANTITNLYGVMNATNAAPVTDTVINGVQIGLTGLNVYTTEATKLTVRTNSVYWYKNSRRVNGMNGQLGFELLGKGLFLGDVAAGETGFVIFQVYVQPVSKRAAFDSYPSGEYHLLNGLINGMPVDSPVVLTDDVTNVDMYMWLHNNVSGTVAQNTWAQVQLPLGTQPGVLSILAQAGANNADTVAGAMNFQNNSTVNSGLAKMEFIPGSVKLYRMTTNASGDNAFVLVQFPSGANPDNLVTTSRLNIGSVYAGYNNVRVITFKVKVTKVK